QHFVPFAAHGKCPADTRDFVAAHDLAVFEPAHRDVINALRGVEQIRRVAGGRLHDDHAADVLPSDVRLVDEAIDKRAQEPAGAELQDGLGEFSHQNNRLYPFSAAT